MCRTTLVICHSILGQIAAKRGNLDEAEVHFANALKVAKLSRLPLMEVIAARDCKRHLSTRKEWNASAVEAVIDAACVKMKKSREDITFLLESNTVPESADAAAVAEIDLPLPTGKPERKENSLPYDATSRV